MRLVLARPAQQGRARPVLGVKVAALRFAPAPPVPAETLTPARASGVCLSSASTHETGRTAGSRRQIRWMQKALSWRRGHREAVAAERRSAEGA